VCHCYLSVAAAAAVYVQDALASYDVNEHDSDPQPRYDFTNENRSVMRF